MLGFNNAFGKGREATVLGVAFDWVEKNYKPKKQALVSVLTIDAIIFSHQIISVENNCPV